MELSQTHGKIRLAVVGNRRLIREFLCDAVACDAQIEVIAQTENEQLAVGLARKFKPDVLLLDIALSPSTALSIIPQIRKAHSTARVLVVAPDLTGDDIRAFVKAGAWGYISTKFDGKSELINAIKAICKGELWIERKITARILKEELKRGFETDDKAQTPIASLSKREKEVLCHLARGLTNKEIAEALFISDKTVKSHINRIFKKLNIGHRMEALLFAIKHQLVHNND